MAHTGPQSELSGLARLREARSGRASSWDQSGRNKDYWLIAPGTSAVLADLEGPGALTHIWFTTFCRRVIGPSIQDPGMHADVAPVTEMENAIGVNWEINDPDYYRKVLIRFTWENSDRPSVLVPLGDFFCIGHAMPGSFNSIPFSISSRPQEEGTFGGTASMNCYFAMPFNTAAKVEIINENDVHLGLFFHIDYDLYPKPIEDIAYFHASWQYANANPGWGDDIAVNTPEVNSVVNDDSRNYVIADIRGRGHFVGCNMSVAHFQGTWWGEGDDVIWVDDFDEPAILGTGSEDYFNHAWGMQRNASLYSGTILHEGDTGGYQVSYRFHVADPIVFNTGIKVTMEHGHGNHLSDSWASTAYWYQEEPGADLTVPPADERPAPKKTWDRPAPASVGELDEYQAAAVASYEERWRIQQEKHAALLQKNAERTTPAERGNVEQARRMRASYDESNS
ncbi:MAG: glycoside hydrolase family 172 protein [Microbacteriaceae bacterium]